MKNRKATKRALLSSVLSLVLCMAMLIGTTFAWFTDSVTSANNKIQAGTLKIDLSLLDEETPDKWVSIKENPQPLFDYDKWEPGYTVARVLRVENKGTLALKWMAKFVSDVQLTKLANVIDVYVCEDVTTYPTRELNGYTRVGTVAEFVNTIEATTNGTLEAGTAETLGIALKMQESAGNEYQGLNLGGAFDIQILATQLTSEEDSFDNQYDKDASYPGEANTASELIDALKAGANIRLGADIDLAGVAWEPIASYSGTFDGAGHSIKNLTINSTAADAGMFAILNGATIKNLKLEDVNVTSTGLRTGALAGQTAKDANAAQNVIANVTVTGAVSGGGYYTGGIIGADRSFDTVMKNCKNYANVTGESQVGGLIGQANRRTVVENGYNAGDVTATYILAGGIIGFVAGDDKGGNTDLRVAVIDSVNTGAVSQGSNAFGDLVGGIAGAVGRDGGDPISEMITAYFIDCTVADGQKIYGAKYNYVSGKDELISAYVGTKLASNNGDAIENAVKALDNGTETVFYLTGATYEGDIDLTVANLGTNKTGKIAFLAADGVTPKFTGLTTLGYRHQGVGATMFNYDVEYVGATFDQAQNSAHSLDIQDVKSVMLTNCTIIGDGEYGIGSASGNACGVSAITGCTFKNAGMQVLGNFGTGLVFDKCTFNNSKVNVQAGNGVTIQNSTFNNTLTQANVGDSFYAIRSNSTPITVKNCKINIDSELTEVATAQAKWYLLANRGTTNWTVSDVAVTLTDAALMQTELDVTACTSTGKINTTNLTVNSVQQ